MTEAPQTNASSGGPGSAPDEIKWARHDHHGHLTPSGPLAERPKLFLPLFVGLVALAVLAHTDTLLSTWDEPIQRWVEDHRTDGLEAFFRRVSFIGANKVIFPVALVMAVVAWFRCRPLSVAIVGAVALRPLFEFVIKDVVGRPRPDFERLVAGTGFSHPSGHVLATVTLYSLLPAVVALYLGRRRVWWITWAFVVALIPAMAACRVYLGVHWPTDVVAAVLWGALYLAVVERIFAAHHVGSCGHPSTDWQDHAGHPHHLDIELIHHDHDDEATAGTGPPG